MMKHHLPELHIHGSEKEDWVHHHTALTAFVIACLIASVMVLLMTMIHVYFTTGIWPLFG